MKKVGIFAGFFNFKIYEMKVSLVQVYIIIFCWQLDKNSIYFEVGSNGSHQGTALLGVKSGHLISVQLSYFFYSFFPVSCVDNFMYVVQQ